MALIRVEPKAGGPETWVDEGWLERWPDDFKRLDKAPKNPESEFPAPIEAQTGGEPTPSNLYAPVR